MKAVRVLGIDTSNYATSLALLEAPCGGPLCVTAALKRFLPVAPGARGLRQSDAVFHHTQALPQLLAQLPAAEVRALDAVGVTARPRPVQGSYMPCFLAGRTLAAGMACARGVPLVETSHQQGHVAAALYACGEEALWQQETLVFHVSGGTTDLLRCRGAQVLERVATSTDLYAGQAVDRLGVRLGLAFPAGAALSALAAASAAPIAPRASVRDGQASFSGLENRCEALLAAGRAPADVARFCLESVACTLLAMLQHARGASPALPVIFAGGVCASDVVRAWISARCEGCRFVEERFSSDNAIGAAVIAAREVLYG